MGKGYHSRSPEEFREYLKSLDQKKTKIKWRQVIIMLDLFLLIFVIYLVFRSLNPGSFQDPTQSTKQMLDGYSSYLSLSRENDNLYQGYFLFIENNSKEEVLLPKKDWSAEYRILKSDGTLCYVEPVIWEPKKLASQSKGFLYHSVSINKLRSLEEGCRKEIFDESYSVFRSKFRYLNLSFFANIIVTTPSHRMIFQIKQKPYRWENK